MRSGFSLVELMVVVAIIALVSVIGGISLSSRLATSRLESASQTIAADLSYARTAALFKGCHTRFILCMDPKCLQRDVSMQAGNFLGNGGQPAQYYAILRRAQYVNINNGCYFDPADAPDPSPAPNYFDNWDFDRKPQALPRGVVFSAIYNTAGRAIDSLLDWGSTTESGVGNTLYFNASPNVVNPIVVPVSDANLSGDLGRAVFQLSFDDCSPSADEDCTGYIISLGVGGRVNVTQCEPGSRSNNTNICF